MVDTLNKTDLINEKISVCLSSSGVSGQQLRSAHYFLGAELAKQIKKKEKLINKKIAVVIMMRAGLPFGLGISDALENSNSLDILFSPVAEKDFAGYDLVIIADAVINTGKTILEFINTVNNKNILIMTNVISEKHISNFDAYNVQAVRISSNSYKGSNVKVISNGKGPDTGDRLFSNSFFK